MANVEILCALLAAQRELRVPIRTGLNTEYQYSYCTELDWYSACMPVLLKHDLILTFTLEKVDDLGMTPSGRQRLVRAHVIGKLIHCPSGQEITVCGSGEGADPNDKALYKAITGAKKYIYAMLLALPTGDDPEKEEEGRPVTPKVELKTVLDAVKASFTGQKLLNIWRRCHECGVDRMDVVRAEIEKRLSEIIAAEVAKDKQRARIWKDELALYKDMCSGEFIDATRATLESIVRECGKREAENGKSNK